MGIGPLFYRTHSGKQHESVRIMALLIFTLFTAMPLWSSHPRVFLDFDHDGNAKCPYCGTQYRLAAGVSAGHH
jgi:uncharacterized Zn-finger protein